MNKSPIGYYSRGEIYFKREYWLALIGWNVYLNYEIEPPDKIIIIYNYYVAEECRKLKRPIYLPFVLNGVIFEVINEE